jgi:Regulator of ribonuclease activity B
VTDEDCVPLFRRSRDHEPVDMNERSPQLGVKYKDLAVLSQLIDGGADLSQPRHVVYYSYAPREETAQEMRREAEHRGFATTVREPLPTSPGQWAVISETRAVTSPDFVRESDDFFQNLADRHAAEYDGWEASV